FRGDSGPYQAWVAPAVGFFRHHGADMRRMGIPLAALARSGLLVTTWRTVSISRTPMLPKTSPPCRPALPLARTRPQHRSARNERRGPTDYLRTGTDHIQSWKEDPARYQAALLAFLRNLS